jgi:hypothetical protein
MICFGACELEFNYSINGNGSSSYITVCLVRGSFQVTTAQDLTYRDMRQIEPNGPRGVD